MTLYDKIQERSLMIKNLKNYLDWRGHTIDRGDLTNMLQGKKTMPDEVKYIVEAWINFPVNPAIYKTK